MGLAVRLCGRPCVRGCRSSPCRVRGAGTGCARRVFPVRRCQQVSARPTRTQMRPPRCSSVAFHTPGRALLTTSLLLLAGFVVVSPSSFELNAGMRRLTLLVAPAPFAGSFPVSPLHMKINRDSNSSAPRFQRCPRKRKLTAPSSPCAAQVVRSAERPDR